jgi:outer membrane biosynthesis protein TonB
VVVFVDENGKVSGAKAVSGHPLLIEKAVVLAKAAQFKPMIIDGKSIRAQGTLIYTFK